MVAGNKIGPWWSRIGPRDFVFFTAGTAFMINEFFVRIVPLIADGVAEEASPRAWGVFAWVFLWGLVPAFQLDGGAVTPRDVVLHLLGMRPPDDPKGPAAKPPPDPEPDGGD